jgi:phosphoserine phosphatase RsbU/P
LRKFSRAYQSGSLCRRTPETLGAEISTGFILSGVKARCPETLLMCLTLLIVFTDGLPEAQNAAAAEFDEARIKEVLVATAHLPVNEIRDAIVQRVKEWIAEPPQFDDLTFVVMKVKSNG